MRIRFYTRTQAICLALSLFLAVFVLGLALGITLAGLVPPAQEALEAFAPMEEATPLITAPPSDTPLPSQITSEINLFAISTPTPEITQAPSETPSPALTPSPPLTPGPSIAPSRQPGEFNIQVIRGPGVLGTTGKKRILIYHSHTYEAYKPTPENTYEITEEWRTKDNQHNVVRIGEELTRLLIAAGFDVVHDATAYEPPVLGTSYTRSLKMLEDSISRGEKYDLYIDLHRNASTASAAASNNTVQAGDQKIARLMMLIGNGAGVTEAGFDARPDWEKNLAIAQAITDSLNEQIPELCRPVKLTKQRYNQHVAPCCILIEVGNNINTLEEALASVPYLSDAIRSVLSAQPAQ
jgi:stage II sporulation protein P